MVPDPITILFVALAVGVGLAFTYFGYSFVTQLTSLVGGLGGALFGSFVARTLAPSVGVAPTNLLLVSLLGALVGGLIGSRVAHSTQRVAIVGMSVLATASVVYSAGGLGTLPLPTLDGAVGPVVGSILAAGVVGVLVWKFYIPFLAVVTSLLGATILQRLAIHWSDVLPVFHADVWTTLGTNHLLWLLVVGSGILIQYRRYRPVKSSVGLRRLSPSRLR